MRRLRDIGYPVDPNEVRQDPQLRLLFMSLDELREAGIAPARLKRTQSVASDNTIRIYSDVDFQEARARVMSKAGSDRHLGGDDHSRKRCVDE